MKNPHISRAPIIQIATAVFLSFYTTGCICSTYFYRGYSPSLESSIDKKIVRTSKGKMFESEIIGRSLSEIQINFRNAEATLLIGTDSGTTHLTSIGPGLLVPLPLIPWPTGIWRSMKGKEKQSINTDIFFYIEFNGFSMDSLLDLSKIKVETFPAESANYHWEIDTNHGWSDNETLVFDSNLPPVPIKITGYSRARLCFINPNPSLEKISMELNGIQCRGQQLDVPKVIFSKGKGLRLWWMPSFNG